jgi:hypothetical protein
MPTAGEARRNIATVEEFFWAASITLRIPMKEQSVSNHSIITPVNPNEDVVIFAENCVFMRSIYLHRKILFEQSTAEDRDRMSRAADHIFRRS